MTNMEAESKINKAVTNALPDVRASVLSRCEEQKGKIIVMSENRKKRSWTQRAAGIAAALVLLVGGAFGVNMYRMNSVPAATISLDVNPSIEIKLSRSEKVLEVVPLNEEGRTVIGDMDFKGSGIELTVNALIGSMLRNGYLSEMANSILVSIDSDDAEEGRKLQEQLTAEINALMQTDGLNGAVLSQTVNQDTELAGLAESYGISLGKAQLIRQISSQDARYSFEDLVGLSINELNLISESGGVRLENVASVGSASDKGYIGEAAALAAALEHAKLNSADISGYYYEMGYERGVMVYELEFYSGDYEYEYDVNASTGEIVKQEREYKPGAAAQIQPGAAGDYIGEEAALELALDHAGLTETQVQRVKCKLDRDDGIMLYEIEFKSGGYEYEYEINALDGSVLKFDKELDD